MARVAVVCANPQQGQRPDDPVCNFPKPITVPQQTYFVLGDNGGASVDSRLFGPIPRAWIIGVAKP